jgi:TRAP-type C4-dicarboxylate transport system permease small subunit
MPKATRNFKPFRLDYYIVALLLFLMAAIAFVNVLSRYFFHFSFAATEEITINLFVWMTVLGTGIAFERGGHLGMVTFYTLFPIPIKKAAVGLSASLSGFLFLIVNIYMLQAIYDEIIFGIDPLWYGVIFISTLAIGQATPPVGVNFFTAANLVGGDLDDIAKEAVPYVLMDVIVLIIISLLPILSLYLPIKAGLYLP